MAKTVFEAAGTVVTSAFMRSIYGQGENGGHRHDGADADGHCAKITKEEIADNLREFIYEVVSDKFIGDVRAYAGNINNIPAGYLLCNGDVIQSIDENYPNYKVWVNNNRPDLVSGGIYRTPDYRGKVLIGAGQGAKDINNAELDFELGDTGGEYEHTLTVAELAKHRHSGNRAQSNGNYARASYLTDNSGGDNDYQLHRSKMTGMDDNTEVGDQPHNNIQPYAVVNYIIRVK